MAAMCGPRSCQALSATSAARNEKCRGRTDVVLATQGHAFTLPVHCVPRLTRAAGVSLPGTGASSISSPAVVTSRLFPSHRPTGTSTSRRWLRSGVVTAAAAAGTAGTEEGLSPEDLRAACPAIKGEVTEEALQAVDLRVGVVVDAKQLPDPVATEKRGKPTMSRTFLKLTVDIGIETRVIVSECRYVMDVEDAVGKKVLVVANVPAKEVLGVQSHGIILTGLNYDPTPMPRTFKLILPGLGRLPPGSQLLPAAVPR